MPSSSKSDFSFSTLIIPQHYLKAILKVVSSSSVEVCGFLFGKENRVLKVRFIRNRLNSPVEFEMDPEEMLKALEEAEQENLEVVGIFHSHIACPPIPSGKDLEGMKRWPVIWLIVNEKGEYKAWILSEKNKISEVKIVVE